MCLPSRCLAMCLHFTIHTSTGCFVWVCDLVFHIKERMQTERLSEEDAAETFIPKRQQIRGRERKLLNEKYNVCTLHDT
jgi:hypothetical protein